MPERPTEVVWGLSVLADRGKMMLECEDSDHRQSSARCT